MNTNLMTKEAIPTRKRNQHVSDNTAHIGHVAMLAVMLDMARHHAYFTMPAPEGQPFDFFAIRGDEVQRVQVKTARRRDDRAGQVVIPCTTSGGRRYTAQDCDIVVGYDFDEQRAYYLRIEDVDRDEKWISKRNLYQL